MQDANHEYRLRKKLSKNRRKLLCFGLIRKLLIFLPVRNNENTREFRITLSTGSISSDMKRYHLNIVD
jgi:hypothetical protein